MVAHKDKVALLFPFASLNWRKEEKEILELDARWWRQRWREREAQRGGEDVGGEKRKQKREVKRKRTSKIERKKKNERMGWEKVIHRQRWKIERRDDEWETGTFHWILKSLIFYTIEHKIHRRLFMKDSTQSMCIIFTHIFFNRFVLYDAMGVRRFREIRCERVEIILSTQTNPLL